MKNTHILDEKLYLARSPKNNNLSQISFGNGSTISIIKYQPNNPQILDEILKYNAVYFIYPTSQDIIIEISGEIDEALICKAKSTTVLINNSPGENNFEIRDNTNNQLTILKIDQVFFEQNPTHCIHDAMDCFYTSELNGIIYFSNLESNERISNIISRIENLVNSSKLKNPLLNSLTMELKYIFFNQYLNFINYKVLNKYEMGKIRALPKAILNHINLPNNPENLAEKINLTVDKLYLGCELIYERSVTDLINDVKLKKISKDLLNGFNDIATVVYSNGYKSRWYFNKIFSDQFGCSPIEYSNNAS